ncbi:MAG TPA: hypothetical protein VLF90_03175 [Patescibacteria group bacterium]|nr:hypothetical protein [Patescibacteria group bacterium]
MKLVEHLPLLDQIKGEPPVKLDLSQTVMPEDVDFTFIGTEHHDEAGEPDYLKEVLTDTDIYMPEFAGWDAELKKRLNRVARGDYKALVKVRQEHQRQGTEKHTNMARYKSAADEALYNTGVRVELVDYPHKHDDLVEWDRWHRGRRAHNEEAYPMYLGRDQHILDSLVSAIQRLRTDDSKIAARVPLRIVMAFGLAHLSLQDALAHAAAEQGITTFQSRKLFEETPTLRSNSLTLNGSEAAELNDRFSHIVGYQNWLREEV